jgi:hypothetical protein
VAGLANIIGANAFMNLSLPEERSLISEDYASSMKGIQVAGLLNYIRNNFSGIQVAGSLNVVDLDVKGLQLAGIGNSAGGTTAGVQLAGLYNLSKESIGGFQVSSLFNYTDAQLAGVQLAMINKASRIKGRRSTPPTKAKGLQIGLINFCKEMDGVQIGLINFGGELRGKQIGLINFFHRAPSKEKVRMGTPVGLLNYGSKGSTFRMQHNELFTVNLEYTTGNCLNCSYVMNSEMPFDDMNQIFNQNALIAGLDPFQHTWGFGYGFQKHLYNKFSIMPSPFNRKRIIIYGLKFIHLNRTMSFDKTFNLVNRLNLDYAKRWRSFYFFVGVSLNYFIYESEVGSDVYKINSLRMPAGKFMGLSSDLWPGYAVGVQL